MKNDLRTTELTIEIPTDEFDDAFTYYNEDEPDIPWLTKTYNVRIDRHDHSTYVTGLKLDLEDFINDHIHDHSFHYNYIKDSKPHTHTLHKKIEKGYLPKGKKIRDDFSAEEEEERKMNDWFEDADMNIAQVLNIIDKNFGKQIIYDLDNVADYVYDEGKDKIRTLSSYGSDDEAVKHIDEMIEFIKTVREAYDKFVR